MTTRSIMEMKGIGEESAEAIVISDDSLEVTKRNLRSTAEEIRNREDSEDLFFEEIAELLSEETGYSVTIPNKFEVKAE